MFELYRMKVSFVTANAAGSESSAKTMSVSSIATSATRSGVPRRRPLSRTTK